MHDMKFFENNPTEIKKSLDKRGVEAKIVDNCLKLNKERKELIQKVEQKKSEVKKQSKEIGLLKKTGKDSSTLVKKIQKIKEVIIKEEKELIKKEENLHNILISLPNIPDISVPTGKDETKNVELAKWGNPPEFDFTAKDHAQLGEDLGMFDFKAAAKLTGPRFVVYKGALARLERALCNFMIDSHIKHGYQEIIAPYIVNSDTLYGTGQLPKFSDDLFKLENRDWYLIPTAEVSLTNLKKNELFSKKELPLRYCSFSPCFRSEAGSYGKDTKGLIRLHQFHKVELVNVVSPDESQKAHRDMIERACAILQDLELPYRQVLLCSGDMGFSANKCIDLEVWLPGQNKYREISSISNCGDFQARRANIRFRNDEGRPQYVHTLNGSGLAVGRTVVAIMENHQKKDGSIYIPEKLRPYMGGLDVIVK
ncbi:MAG: serine--tRNA ligase [Halobacteriovoraceae bacterium]|nr:serine--tRNA ligase [Halobacteriovoraceae bacterium]